LDGHDITSIEKYKVMTGYKMENQLHSTLEYLIAALAGVVARVVTEPRRSVESLRGRMGESER